MAYDPRAVANHFLDLANTKGQRLTHMKLQKLLYFAHGWYLGLTGAPLLDEPIQAWKYGPVIPKVYREFKHFGGSPIEARATYFDEIDGFPRPVVWQMPEGVEHANARHVIERVLEVYGQYDALQLSAMTHAPGTPWTEAVAPHQGYIPPDLKISNDAIRQYFARQAEASRQQSRR